jgi:hypothetical protein
VNVHTGTVVVMFSHESRALARVETIEAFARVGAPVAHVHVQHERPKQAHNRRSAWQALKAGVELIAPRVDAAGVLVIEDDVDPASTLVDWLRYLEAHEERPVTLYLANACRRCAPVAYERVAAGREVEPHVASLVQPHLWWGSQAVWFPYHVARAVVADQRLQAFEHGLGPWDHALRVIFQEQGATLGVAVPNVVQHRGLRNVILPRKGVHRSEAFDGAAPAPTPKEA